MTAQPSSQAEREDVALLPCPFDGRPAYYVQIDGVRWAARCAYCHVTRGGNLEKADAALSWNTRPNREHATPRSMPEEVVRLRAALQDAVEWLRTTPLESGVCCCGNPVNSHGMGDGHSPVDELTYSASNLQERLVVALNSPNEKGRRNEHLRVYAARC